MAQLSNLQQRELEYHRLNDEMEQKTAVLMQEAEQMLRKHEALLDRDETTRADVANEQPLASKLFGFEPTLMGAVDVEIANDDEQLQGDTGRKKAQRRVLLSATERTNVDAAGNDASSQPAVGATSTSRRSAPAPRAVAQHGEEAGGEILDDDGVIPAVAGQMSVEAQLRFYKAKVRVLQEELDRTQHELALRSRESDSLNSRVQEADEDRSRLTRQVASLQQALTKQKKFADDNEARASALERTLDAVRRDADSARRDNKKATTDKSAQEVRLNRAVEEAEHLRQELAKARAMVRDSNTDESRKAEKLAADVRRLERQRGELIAAFKKSLKLIDVLKRQKLHLEAARLLQFREEEFVRALDWDKQAPINMPVNEGPLQPSVSSRTKQTAPFKRAPLSGASSAKTTSSATQHKPPPLNLIAEGHAEPLVFDEDIAGGDSDTY